MSDTSSLTVALPTRLATALTSAVEAGEFRSVDDAMSEAVALWHGDRRSCEDELEDFRAKLRGAEDDPRPDLTIDEVRAYLAARARSDEAA